MMKTRDKCSYGKIYPLNTEPPSTHYRPNQQTDMVSNQQRYESMESRYSNYPPYVTGNRSYESSRIADEGENLNKNYESFQASVLKKVESIEEETNNLLQKKERELYFLRIDLQNCEATLRQAEETIKAKNVQISELKKGTVSRSRSRYVQRSVSYDVRDLQEQNSKLKQSIRVLIEEKNQNQRNLNKSDYLSNNSKINVQNLKREVEELRTMVSQMENLVTNCPSCFTLKRNIQQLTEAYEGLLKEYTELKRAKSEQEKGLLQNITKKIQENQNILRENQHLQQQKSNKPYLRHKGQRLKESVAKRCRTLTDQF